MSNIIRASALVFLALGALLSGCKKDEAPSPFEGLTFQQQDQMARPAINTVFVSTADKDDFNTTIPSLQSGKYATKFMDRLMALNPGYTTNALGMNAATFSGALVTDVLNVATSGKTTFFDGTNVLTGRALADDVISTELLLIFGGPTGASNPGLTDDHVNANDKPFLTTFPFLAAPH